MKRERLMEKKEHPLERYMYDDTERKWFRHYIEKRDIIRATGKLIRASLRKAGRIYPPAKPKTQGGMT